jgi:hypothetical protein
MTRKKIGLGMSVRDVVVEMSEGNPGAINVMMSIINSSDEMRGSIPAAMILLHLYDMNIRGPQIWLAYKDWAGQDLGKLIKAVMARDLELVTFLNAYADKCPGMERAVTSGASFD